MKYVLELPDLHDDLGGVVLCLQQLAFLKTTEQTHGVHGCQAASFSYIDPHEIIHTFSSMVLFIPSSSSCEALMFFAKSLRTECAVAQTEVGVIDCRAFFQNVNRLMINAENVRLRPRHLRFSFSTRRSRAGLTFRDADGLPPSLGAGASVSSSLMWPSKRLERFLRDFCGDSRRRTY